MDIKERLEQNKIDTEKLLEEKERLERELKEQEKVIFKHGDIVIRKSESTDEDTRVILFTTEGILWAFDRFGYKVGSPDSHTYKKSGKNVFHNNLLGLVG